jgi:cell division protein FtsB
LRRSESLLLEAPLDSALARRIIWNVLPTAIVVGALWMALAGKEGLLKRHAVKQRLIATEERVQQQQIENEILRARIRGLRQDPISLRRVAAERLLMAEAGSTIYRFTDEAPAIAAAPSIAPVPATAAAPATATAPSTAAVVVPSP